jgi:NADH-quinone oxidoreductase subunit N
MNANDLLVLLPLLVIAATSVVVMLIIAFYRSHALTVFLTLAGLALAFISLSSVAPLLPRRITPLFVMDGYSLFYMGLLFASGLVVAVLSHGYMEGRQLNHDEFYLLLLLATLGSAVLVASNHFASFFLGLEILSVSLYTMIAYLRASDRGNEAGVKYLILASASAAFLLFGMALVYARLGTMEFAEIARKIVSADQQDVFLFAGQAMIVIGIGFKLALVPFHMWTPDVYEGAPAPVTAFIATSSKGAMFALLLRYFGGTDIHPGGALFPVFAAIAAASMFTGNLLALLQNNVKRILAYSSIAHLGYLLVAFLASGTMATTAVGYYLSTYFLTTLGAFGVISILSGKERDADMIEDYRGLARRRPWIAAVFIAMLLSLAGIPLTAGFVGKFYVVAAGVGSGLWILVVTLVINSAIGLFYYLRVVAALFTEGKRGEEPAATAVPVAAGLVMLVLSVLLVWLGVYPSSLIEILEKTVTGLV